MKAQMSRVAEAHVSRDPEPTTPVIIKIGGGDPSGNPGKPHISGNPGNLKFLADLVPFKDDSGEVWNHAVSNSLGRIASLTIKDGKLQPVTFAVTPSLSAFVSLDVTLEVTNAQTSLVVSEENEGGGIRLHAQSAEGFRITKGSPRDWQISEGEFSGVGVSCTFTQQQLDPNDDDYQLTYVFNFGDDVELELGFVQQP